MKAMTSLCCIVASILCWSDVAFSADASNTDKTLVAWVEIDNPEVCAGSILTVQDGAGFDGIVYAERQPGVWMAGSNYYHRSGPLLNPVPAKDPSGVFQMAIVYGDGGITIYRNGERYQSYSADESPDFLSSKSLMVVFGLRHLGGNGSIEGKISDARIYDRALTQKEISNLVSDQDDGSNPLAWWDFEQAPYTDKQGHYKSRLVLKKGAAVEGGRLVLKMNARAMAFKAEGFEIKPAKIVCPENPPYEWATYHLRHPAPLNAPGDPNPAFYYEGKYHLHYIYGDPNPMIGISFAHVSSPDMVHWKWHPTTLHQESTGHGMFSGTGFFTKEGQPAMVYCGWGSGRNQLSYGLDDELEQWSEPEEMVAFENGAPKLDVPYFDPDCWIRDGVYYGLNGVSSSEPPLLMKSTDLKNWQHLGPLLHPDFDESKLGVSAGEDISCPNMFQMEDKWVLFCISHRLGCRYFIGDWVDEQFLPEAHHQMSWVDRLYFAPETWLTADGRRVLIVWLVEGPIQSLPRELRLSPDKKSIYVTPIRELESLRGKAFRVDKLTVRPSEKLEATILDGLKGDTVEILIESTVPMSGTFGMDLLGDASGTGAMRLEIDPAQNCIRLGNETAPFECKPDHTLKLRIFLDREAVEVFANGVQGITRLRPHEKVTPNYVHNTVFSSASDWKINLIRRWEMKSIH